MLHPSEELWATWNIESEHHRFFVLRWQELFDLSTFDSWQVRSANIRSLLGELEDSIQIVRVAKNHHPNINALLQEARVVLKHDRVIRTKVRIVEKLIDDLSECYETEIKTKDPPDTEQFTRLVHIVCSHLSSYCELLFDEIEQILRGTPSNYKIDLHTLTMLLGIELKNQGLSVQELRDSFRIFADNTGQDFMDGFSKLRKTLTEKQKDFKCLFLIRGPGSFNDVSMDSVQTTHADPTNSETESEFWDQDTGGGVTGLVCRVSARDVYAARRISHQKIEELLAYFRIYRPSKEHTVHAKVLIYPPDSPPRIVEHGDEQDVRLPSDARGPDQKAIEFLERLSRMNVEHTRHVAAALQYFRLSLYARKQEARLINLWIAIEALFQDIGHGSLVGRVTRIVSTIMALNYVQSISRAIPVDVRNVWRGRAPNSVISVLPNSSKRILHSDDFILLMTSPDTSDIWAQFAGIFSDNPLMIFRLWKLREGLYANPVAMAERMEQHRNSVAWQIQRIYRLRNRIAHQGFAASDSSQLIGHLQTYFVTTFHDIVHTTRQRTLPGLGDILESRSKDFDYLLWRLKNEKDRPFPVKFVATGFAEFDGRCPPFLWSDLPTAGAK